MGLYRKENGVPNQKAGNADYSEIDALKSSLTKFSQMEKHTLSDIGWVLTKCGNVVDVNWVQNSASYTANQVIGTLPTEFRPPSQVRRYVVDGNSTIRAYVLIETNGEIKILNTFSGANLRTGFSYGVLV